MSGAVLVGAALLSVAVGAGVFALIAEKTLGGELGALGARFGIQGSGGASQLLGVLDTVAPGESDKIKTAAIVTALGGAAAGVALYAVLREVLA